LCLLQIALLLLELNLSLDHIRMRHLAAVFQLLADVEKVLRLVVGLCAVAYFR